MRVLLVRPDSPNERFGLGPFFRVEPLGLEYVGAALARQGHVVRLVDMRFHRSLHMQLARFQPSLVAISCTHTVDVPTSIRSARIVKRWKPSCFVLIGGHAAASFPSPLMIPQVDAISTGDGEIDVGNLVHALQSHRPLDLVPGFFLRDDRNEFCSTGESQRCDLNDVALPHRALVRPYQSRYLCVHKTPLWAVETTRGCPYRCSFCSIWRHHGRTLRCRSIDAVCDDFASVGANVFVIDDLFWHPASRSLELANHLKKQGIRKDWILVQARLDTVARNEKLLRAWRPLARQFDIFFGFEAPTNHQLDELHKDTDVSATELGVGVARELGYGVTGNFVVNPNWSESDFEAMWAMVDRLQLNRAGFTVLTPLPGTPLFDSMRDQLTETDWSKWDMHHLLVEPRLGRQRFFELFVKSWKRNVLSAGYSTTKWWKWARELEPKQLLLFARVMLQTQRMLSVRAYVKESIPAQTPASLSVDPSR